MRMIYAAAFGISTFFALECGSGDPTAAATLHRGVSSGVRR